MTDDLQVILPTPDKIKEHLDQYVIGQEEAKKVLSVAAYNHYKRIFNNAHNQDVEIDKSNILITGETGSGKTLLVKTLANFLNVPCYIADATSITESGYVGDDVESILVGLLRSCNYNFAKAELGIVVIDEFDKIAKRGANASITRDVSGEGVQQALLKIVEGDIIGVPPAEGRKHPQQELLYINTKNILFIASGAFVGIDNHIKHRIGCNQMGLKANNTEEIVIDDEIIKYITPHDLKSFGFIPELIGRFPVITYVNKLTENDLLRIMTEPKNAIIKQYKELMKIDGTVLAFDDDALLEVVKTALELKIGARGLRNIMENVMMNHMFDSPKNGICNLHITLEMVKEIINTKFKFKKVA